MLGVRRVFSFVCLLAFLLVHIAAAEAATAKKKPEVKAPVSPPMIFAIVRSGVTGCEPNCPQWISAEGQIMPGSAGQFRKILKRAGKMRLPVVITSQGGDVEAALAMGNMIRERKLDVVVGWTLFTGCNPTVKTCKLPKEQKGVYAGLVMTNRAYCFSACPFILAGGQKRMVGSGALIGVHEITTQPITQRIRYNETYRMVNGKKKVLSRKVVSRKNIIGKMTTKLSKPFDRKLRTYLTTMEVSLTMLDLLHLAPPSSIHNLTTDEMRSTKLVTEFGNAGELVSNSLCKTTPPADNCLVNKTFEVTPPTPKTTFTAASSSMSFSIVRSNQAGCEPFCTEWVYADGKISSDTPADFQKFLKQSAAKGLPVIIRSDGGDEAAAMALGRIFRREKIGVEVGATLFTGCSTSRFYCRSQLDRLGKYSGFVDVENDYCNSACVLALAGGKRRVANYGNNIRLQNFDNKQGPSREELGKYLNEMGVGRVLITLMEKAKPTELLGLTYDQARAADLVKIRPYGSGLTNAFRCYDAPPPENCVRR